MALKLSQTQSLALTLLNDPQIAELLFGGGAGGAKSVLVCIWMVLECRQYPGIRIGLGRKELVRLKQTTVVTLLSKVHGFLGVKREEFVYNDQKGTIAYANGSMIQLIDMAPAPRDPDFDTFGSLELTHVVIEEVGEVVKKAVDVLTTRKNRFLNKEYGIVGKTVMTCNPTQNFVRREFYDPYADLGAGRWQKWAHGVVELPDGEMVTAYRAFIRSLVFDNPFASRNYIETLRMAPPAERKRLLEGDWNYQDGDNMLFTDLTLDRTLRSQFDSGHKRIGVDISDGGKDSTQATVMEGKVVTEIVQIPIDPTSPVDPAEQVALGIIKVATQRKIRPHDVGIDGVGVGAGVRAILRSKGWNIQVFIGGAAPTEPGYGCLRDEQVWKTSQEMQSGELGILASCPQLTELREELKPHEYSSNEKVIKVTPKTPGRGAGVGKSIKEILGRSPDRADSLFIARWLSEESDSQNAENHIIF
jgi:phage terminase large subunit